ncbi:NAD-dependent epimerase/dehydratase family protein, partial [Candidatus Pelagibacter sp.]|nr:NAD-dependent epimerase/dehydratase family protein [Candidatus Pelagibacter sp.]
MAKIIITGAAGFIGYHLIKKIINKNYDFILIDDYSRGKKDEPFNNIIKKRNIKFLNQDLTKSFKIKDQNIKYIFHLAARIGVKNVIEKPSETINDNLLMLINTINAVKKNNKKVKIIFFSTSEIYSPLIENKTAKFPLKEKVNFIIKNKIQARDSYYISKLVGEKIVELSGYEYINLRPHNVYGPRMGYSHVIPELINKFKNKEKKIKIFSPTHKRAFCYVDDAINQMIKLAFNKKASNNAFNIGNNKEEIKIIDLANKISGLLNIKKKLIRGSNTLGSPIRRVPDMVKTNNLT